MSSSFILDCSLAAAWAFEDERTSKTDAVLERLAHQQALVPHHWAIELVNVLATAERRQRISRAASDQFLRQLDNLDILVDRSVELKTATSLLPLCRQYGLASYDAAYLELALRSRLPLATLDRALQKAARKAGADLVDL